MDTQCSAGCHTMVAVSNRMWNLLKIGQTTKTEKQNEGKKDSSVQEDRKNSACHSSVLYKMTIDQRYISRLKIHSCQHKVLTAKHHHQESKPPWLGRSALLMRHFRQTQWYA